MSARSASSAARRIANASASRHSRSTASIWDATSTAGPSHSTISTEPAPSGYPALTDFSAASMASASMISAAAGVRPAAMMALTAAPASSMVPNAASTVTTSCGLRSRRTATLVAMPRVPSAPTNTPTRS